MCGRNEFELFVQTLGWTKVLVQPALALTKLNVKFLLHPVTPAGLRAVAAARQYLVEHGLVQWVAHQNLTKGIAPTAAVAAQELVTPSAPLGLVTPSAPRAWTTAKHERQWVRRWSRRFNLQRGCFKVGPRLPLAASRLKAALPANGRRRFQKRMNLFLCGIQLRKWLHVQARKMGFQIEPR